LALARAALDFKTVDRLGIAEQLDRLDLSAAEAGHLLGVHRATIYRWLDDSMSVPTASLSITW
jgi:hypothetical protein